VADPSLVDDDLVREALAATPDPPVPDDAVPFDVPDGPGGPELLPAWYMPAPRATSLSGRRTVVVAALVASLVLVNAVGLCVTYGLPEIAW
jgi:hypothetical protein